MTILAEIGRPFIGGEYLTIEKAKAHGYYDFGRHKKMSNSRSVRRVLNTRDLPAYTMIDDLLGAIEAIMADGYVHIDGQGITGKEPTLRERFAALAAHGREP